MAAASWSRGSGGASRGAAAADAGDAAGGAGDDDAAGCWTVRAAAAARSSGDLVGVQQKKKEK